MTTVGELKCNEKLKESNKLKEINRMKEEFKNSKCFPFGKYKGKTIG